MSKGYLGLALHAHLPFVRHPEYERFLEEDWLFEGISETYLPLLRMFNRLKKDEIPFRVTMSISPTLSAMLTDELLQQRYIEHLNRLIELGHKEVERNKNNPELLPLSTMYRDLYEQNLQEFNETYRLNILWGFKKLEQEGNLEIITTAATHPFFPLFQDYPEMIEAQFQMAIIDHGRNFGKEPKGFWLPECGYYPGIEKYMKSHDLHYSFIAAHGILMADRKTQYGVYAPLQCPNGVQIFGRDYPTSHAVWSEEDGYPGDFVYRDFYRDIGYDLPLDYIRPYIQSNDLRVYTGYKYHAITGLNIGDKKPYCVEIARKKVKEHAENFVYNRIKQIHKISSKMDRLPYIVASFDAELFGHWWFEGVQWVEDVIRICAEKKDQLEMITPSDYLEKYPDNQVATPSFSSWGNKGYAEVWLDGSNDWIYRHIHKAIERMSELVDRYPKETGLKARVLNQAAREVMLSMASDWPFIMKIGTAVPYAEKRIGEHLHNFNTIYDKLCRNTVDTEWLTKIEKKNNVFPDIDYRVFRKIAKKA